MPLAEAVKEVKTFTAKFDQTINCVMHLGIDTKQADQLVRGSLSLPQRHRQGQTRNRVLR